MDEHIPRSMTEGLRERRIDVLTVQEDSRSMSQDDLLLTRSTELERLMVTNDPDFLKLAKVWIKSGAEFSGIVFWSQQSLPIGKCIEELDLTAKQVKQASFAPESSFFRHRPDKFWAAPPLFLGQGSR